MSKAYEKDTISLWDFLVHFGFYLAMLCLCYHTTCVTVVGTLQTQVIVLSQRKRHLNRQKGQWMKS